MYHMWECTWYKCIYVVVFHGLKLYPTAVTMLEWECRKATPSCYDFRRCALIWLNCEIVGYQICDSENS